MTLKKRKGFLAFIGIWLIASTSCSAETQVKGPSPDDLEKKELVRVSIHQLISDPATQQPVVSLADSDEKRALLIWIGLSEARAIYAELQGIKHIRPLTHDLIAKIINKIDGKIHHIVITHTKESIFYATIMIEKDGTLVEVDARPSDSIVMALKFKAPIFVSGTLFEKMSFPMEEQKGIEEQYGLTLQELTPELAKYLSFEAKRGVMVSVVHKGSRADTDGIETGDIFVEVGEQIIEGILSMKDAIAKSKAPVKARIFRKARFLIITLHLH